MKERKGCVFSISQDNEPVAGCMPYFTLTPSFSICPVHGYIPGAHENCPLEK